MSSSPTKPLVGIAASIFGPPDRPVTHHSMGERYVQAVSRAAGAVPMLIPALGAEYDIADLADRIDGLLLPGGRANIEPHHYGGPPFPEDEVRDPLRDATVLPLIRACIDKGVPIFGICRGIQELNVALGGSLHYRVHELPGKMDHRMPREGTSEEKFALRHHIEIDEGGLLTALESSRRVKVNSAHGQGLDRVASDLTVEAMAEDGIIEAVSLRGAPALTVAVQWHAEWNWETHDLSRALFAAFGEASAERAARRRRVPQPAG